jgi:hypothetical protein
MLAISEAAAPAVSTVPGQVILVLLVAAGLALPTSLALLWLYRHAVLRSMQAGATSRPLGATTTEPLSPAVQPTPLAPEFVVNPSSSEALAPGAQALHSQMAGLAYRTAIAYALGGIAFAIVMTASFLAAGKLEALPVRSLLLFWSYAWPVVLTTTLALGSRRRQMLLIAAAYFLGLAAISAAGVVRSPAFDWKQAAVFWLINNGPPTILLLAYLNRRVRAVGPLVLLFMLLAVTGATAMVSLAGAYPPLLRLALRAGTALGLGGIGIFWGLQVVGFVLFGAVGWLVLGRVRRRYDRKKMSDESITFDAIWLLFGVAHGIDLFFEGAAWILSGLVAFAAYKLVSTVALTLLRGSRRSSNVRLLLLRVFALGKRSERLFDVLGSYWRQVGSIQLIAGPDLATKTVEPHEFLDFLTGKLARRFIDGPDTLNRRLSEMDVAPDRDGRYRVNDFFCHDDTWRTVFSRLATESDTVLMDLRSFSPQRAGITFELEEVLNLVPLERAVFVIDDTTSQELLRQTITQSWGRLRPASPNLGLRRGQVRLLHLGGGSVGSHTLLAELCNAATAGRPADVGVAQAGPSLARS